MIEVFVGLLIAAGVVSLVAVGGLFAGGALLVRRGYYALRGKPYQPVLGNGSKEPAYQHQDVAAGATASSISRVLRAYENTPAMGPYAQAGLAALDNEQRRGASYRAVLNAKFAEGSLSWQKFAQPAESVHEAILGNCAQLANSIQTFDIEGYQRLERMTRRSPWRPQERPSATDMEKHRLLQQSLAQMDRVLASNDRLLLELDKLAVQLGTLSDADTAANDRVVDEIRTLIDETKYYSQ